MINKKISKVLGPVLGIMGFILAIGVMETSASAEENVQTNSVYTNATTSAAVTIKDYSVNINKSETQNGIKVTVDKAIATKDKLKVEIKVENQTAFDKTKKQHSDIRITYGENNFCNESISYKYPDDKTLIISVEQQMGEKEFQESGNLRVDLVMPGYKVNLGIDSNVDFSNSFKNTIEKDIYGKIPEFDYTLDKLESSVLGTRITYSEPRKDEADEDTNYFRDSSSFLLKAGDKMYLTRNMGSYSAGSKDDNNELMGSYESEGATYDKIKDQNNISIIPIICNMTDKEIEKIYEDDYQRVKNKNDKLNNETTNNVSYSKEFDFIDGSKGQIYNIERNDNSVKVYCKGATEKESILMAVSMSVDYKIDPQNGNFEHYDSEQNMSMYKDSKDTLGYIVEFDNLDKDKNLELYNDSLIKQIDKYKIEDEIQLTK